MSNVDNPYRSPPTQAPERRLRQGAALSTRAMRFATLGVLVGVGFGFAVLAITLKSAFERRSLDEAYPTIDYVTPLIAFAFWSITTGAVFSVVGGTLGFIADALQPMRNLEVGEQSDPPKSPVCREFES